MNGWNSFSLAAICAASNPACSTACCCWPKAVSATEYKGGAIREFGYNVTAHVCSIRSLRLTDDATIANYVIASGGVLDSFGGAAISSLPYHNTPLNLLPLIDPIYDWTEEDVSELEDNAISVIGNNPARNSVILGDMVTTYLTDSAGNSDVTWKFLNGVDTDVAIREYIVNNLRSDYAQSRLSSGRVINGRSIATEASIKARLDIYYNILSGVDYVLVSNGQDDINFWKDNRTVSIDLANGQVTITAKFVRVSQFRSAIGTLQTTFDITQ